MGESVFLVGFMGSGKSSVGRLLAERLGRPFVDLDRVVEDDLGLSIAEIFRLHGESVFREAESRLLRSVLALGPAVVALGGGAYSVEANRETLRSGGVAVWLDVPLETAWTRCAHDPARPLAAVRSDFEQLYRRRRADYRLADRRIDAAGKTPPQIAAEIERRLNRTAKRAGSD